MPGYVFPPPPQVIIVSPDAAEAGQTVSPAVEAPVVTADPALIATLSGIEKAWTAGQPAQLGAYLPASGGVQFFEPGRSARVVSREEFLGLAGTAMARGTTLTLDLGRLEQPADGVILASGQRVFRTPAGSILRAPVYYLLQLQGQRWVIVAADIGATG